MKNFIISALLVYVFLFPAASGVFSQRVVQYDQYSTVYFDSVRALVNDTARGNYTINAYRLSGSDEIVIDGHLDETAWKNAEHRGGFAGIVVIGDIETVD